MEFTKNNSNHFSKGFTLIELLVVIAIIGMLSGMVLVSMSGMREKARDARRKSDIAQIRKALELYYVANEKYPLSGSATYPSVSWTNSNHAASWNNFAVALAPYIVAPKDPINTSDNWAYNGGYNYAFFSRAVHECSLQQWYMIVYRLEKPDMVSPGASTCDGYIYNYSNTITIGMRQQ